MRTQAMLNNQGILAALYTRHPWNAPVTIAPAALVHAIAPTAPVHAIAPNAPAFARNAPTAPAPAIITPRTYASAAPPVIHEQNSSTARTNRVADANRAAGAASAEPAAVVPQQPRTAPAPVPPSAAEPVAHAGAQWGGLADDDDDDNDPMMILNEETNATCKGFPPHWRVRKVNARVYHVFSPAGEQYTSLKAAKQALSDEGDDVCWECRGPGASLSCPKNSVLSSLMYRAQVS